jgi:hypothetical protein
LNNLLLKVFGLSILIGVLLIAPVVVDAQEEFVPPPAKHITSLPFTMLTGGIIIVRATIDSFPDSLSFVLDTGSGGISLDSITCNYLHIKREMSSRVIRGIAGMKTVEFAYNHSLNLTGLTVEKLDFHINDYDILSSVYGIKIDGIIGYSFFRRYIVTLDYDKMMMDVYTPGIFKYPRGGHLLRPMFSTLPMQLMTIKDEESINGRFYFDTGAGLCMLLSEDIVEDSLLLKKNKKLFPTQAEGLGGKKEMNLTVLKEVKLGPYRFKKVPAYIFDDEFNVTSYPMLGGLIGNDILRRFNIVLNYPDQQIFIKPNKRFNDSFDYSYNGLGIYIVEGAITAVDIMKNSPAEKAGFQEGDIIVAVDNNVSNNIQTYKSILQTANSRVRVLVLRNGEPKMLTIKVKSIL